MPDFILTKQFVNLVGHLAWPVTAIIVILLTRNWLTQIVTAITKRIEDPHSKVELPYGIKFSPLVFDVSEPSKKLSEKIEADPTFAGLLESWLKSQNQNLSPTAFINDKKYVELRIEAVQHFNL